MHALGNARKHINSLEYCVAFVAAFKWFVICTHWETRASTAHCVAFIAAFKWF
jgi:hypothetical protein